MIRVRLNKLRRPLKKLRKPISGLRKPIVRMRHLSWWRRSRGFGVHSPFAYSFIKGTLTEKTPYRQYEEFKGVSEKDFQRACMLFRLVCRFRPSSVIITAHDELYERAVSAADSRSVITNSGKAQLVVVNDSSDFKLSMLDEDAVVYFPSVQSAEARQVWRALFDNMKRGMTFSDGRQAVACLFKTLPRQHYNVFC